MINKIKQNQLLEGLIEEMEQTGVKIVISYDTELKYQGYYDEVKQKITLAIPCISKEGLFSYHKNECFGDIDFPDTLYSFKNPTEENITLYKVIEVLYHQYKHFLQDLEGSLVNLTDEKIYFLEEQAEMYACKKSKEFFLKNINEELNVG